MYHFLYLCKVSLLVLVRLVKDQYHHHYHQDCILQMYANPDSIQHCLNFYYHMQGSNIGTLNVYAMAQNQQLSGPVWTRSIDQGYGWKEAEVTIGIISRFQVGRCIIRFYIFVTAVKACHSCLSSSLLYLHSLSVCLAYLHANVYEHP